jgi:hypothetical protein
MNDDDDTSKSPDFDEIPTALIILDQDKPQFVLRCLVSLVFNFRYGLRTVEASSFEEAR